MNIYIGWDARESIAYDVAAGSILRRTESGVPIDPLTLGIARSNGLDRPIEQRDGKMWCPISQAPMATEFAISRFAVPFIQKNGWALFVDCDIICLADIAELFTLADERYAVQCVMHYHTPKEQTKMDGQVQTSYARKNWSSVVLWNCEHPANKRLTLEKLNTLPGRDLHAFCWLENNEIGALPNEWNHLVGVDPPIDGVKIAHYTLGGPWIPGWPGRSIYDELWKSECGACRE